MFAFDWHRVFSFASVIPSTDLYLQGAGTNEKVLTEILASRTPAEVRNIKQVYLQGNVLYKIKF